MKRSERLELRAAIEQVKAWVKTAAEIDYLASHMPLSTHVSLPGLDPLMNALRSTSLSHDMALGSRLARTLWFHDRTKLALSHEAAARLKHFYSRGQFDSATVSLKRARTQLIQQQEEQRSRLAPALSALESASVQAHKLLHLHAHLPIAQPGPDIVAEVTSQAVLATTVDQLLPLARHVLAPQSCHRGNCADSHAAATRLFALATDPATTLLIKKTPNLKGRIRDCHDREILQLRRAVKHLKEREGQIAEFHQARERATQQVTSIIDRALRNSQNMSGEANVTFVPVGSDLTPLQGNLCVLATHSPSTVDKEQLTRLTKSARTDLAQIERVFDKEWRCNRISCEPFHHDAEDLVQRISLEQADLERILASASPDKATSYALFAPELRLLSYLPAGSSHCELLDEPLTRLLPDAVLATMKPERAIALAADRAKEAAKEVRAGDVERSLRSMDLEVLRQAARPGDRFRTAALEARGVTSAWEVLKLVKKRKLIEIPGLGEASARAISQSCLRVAEGIRDETPVRLDVKERPPQTARLLAALDRWRSVRDFRPKPHEIDLARGLDSLFERVRSPGAILVVHRSPPANRSVLEDLTHLVVRTGKSERQDIWTDFLSRPATTLEC